MKKVIFLSIAILGMALGSLVTIQPAHASGGIWVEWIGPDGCEYADCQVCFFWDCGGGVMHLCDE
jgi:hypothetical protein